MQVAKSPKMGADIALLQFGRSVSENVSPSSRRVNIANDNAV